MDGRHGPKSSTNPTALPSQWITLLREWGSATGVVEQVEKD